VIRAASTLVFRPFSLAQALRGLAETGFANVELGAIKDFLENLNPDRVSRFELRRARRLLGRYDQRCVSLSAHAPLHTETGRRRVANALRIAVELGAGVVNTVTGDPETAAEGVAFRENTLALADQAAMLGVLLCLETDSRLLPSGQAAAVLLDDLAHPGIRLNYDCGNVRFLSGLDPTADLEHALPYLGHVHLKDQLGGRGAKLHPPLGEGDIDLGSFLGRLRDRGFAGPVSMEIEFGGDGWPDWNGCLQAARQGKEHWDQLEGEATWQKRPDKGSSNGWTKDP
jgi:sugar phosphate isomerase/epimerase